MGCLVILLLTFLVLYQDSQGFNLRTRQICCSIGTNYSSNSHKCETFQPPIPGIPIEDERACLNAVDFCCKKELKKEIRIVQCNSGKQDAKSGTCIEEEGDRKDCCDSCRMGIDAKKSGENCVDSLGLEEPLSGAFISCCKEAETKPNSTTPITTSKPDVTISAESAKYSKPPEEVAYFPGLSEENICETGEYCAQLCVPSGGSSYRCSCFPGYTLMKDGVSCKPLKRANGRRCQENNPCDHDCFDTGTAIECSCRKGYELAPDKISCKDINECLTGEHECGPNETCENDEGNYYCFVPDLEDDDGYNSECPVGHKFNAEKSVCDDVDECEIPLICSPPKICKNSIGSFSCEGPDCPPGFFYKASIENCADIDECLSGDNNCNKDSELCVNTKGNYTCVDKASRKACPPGFKKNDETLLCEDIDECKDDLRVCLKNERCINEEGGYKCLKLDSTDKLSNNIPGFTPPTTNKPLGPPSCPLGFKYNLTQNTCDDINECQLRLDHCSPMHRCDNTVGSFYCTRTVSCGTGYTLNTANDLCEDDDECALGTHKCNDLGTNFRCKNQMGTYRCEAIRPLYRPIASSIAPTTSSSITPAHTLPKNTLPATHPKTATSTSTSTLTSTATSTSTSTSTSSSITLKPISIRNAWGEPFYSNQGKPWWFYPPATPRTVARYSYPPQIQVSPKPSPSEVTERNYPESYNSPYSRTSYNPFQISTRKSTTSFPIINGMLKKCLPGYTMNANGDCLDINECESNPCPRGSKCLNFNGRFECSSPLYCKIGYEPNEAGDECIDVDECAKGTHNCSKSQTCKNGQGYYTCECPPGHHLNRLTQVCEDLDECKFYRPCGNYAECTNIVGSYTCTCKPGFKMNQNFCDDINECQESPGLCQDSCINVWGSYRCACKKGFYLNPDNTTCTDIDECEKFKDNKLCIGPCVNIPGSYVCECPRGYKLGTDKRVCIDIDECQHNVCAPQDACVNIRGGYKCYPITCTDNYVKDPNHKARCKRLTCDPRDNECLLMPEQYSYQYMALVSNLPLSEGGIPLFKIKGPDWTAARAEFTLKVLDVICPPGIKKADESYVRKIIHENNLMELSLVRSIQGPQEVKLQVEMKLFHGNNLMGSVVVYIIIVVSEYPF